MADQHQLDLLKQGTNTWNAWRKSQHDITPDLRGAILSDAALSGANLSKAILSGAILSGAILNGAILNRANLNRANLNRANLNEADLNEADLSEADLSGTDLSSADLSDSVLIGADLSEANLSGAILSQAKIGWTIFGHIDLRSTRGLEKVRHEGPSYISTSTLSWSEGEIPEAFLRGTGLDDTFITYVHSLTNSPIKYYTCFISYSSKDELFAQRLHNDLQQRGVRCWFAPEDMDIGDKIKHRIDESIRLYDKLLLILSEHAIASNWVAYEVERALNKEPKGKPNVLYPVRVDKAVLTCRKQWAKDIKETRHIGNFEEWTDPQKYQDNFQRLLHALNTEKKQRKN